LPNPPGQGSACTSAEGRAAQPPFYSAADAFELRTAYETFSLVTIEAAATGLPLLVTRVSGVEDVLVDGENGWFIDPDPAVIADCLARLQKDETLRREMGNAARAAVSEYGWPRVVDQYGQLYAEISAGAPAS
jgi:glycosyltransferase involved in cell wall biosynthesis